MLAEPVTMTYKGKSSHPTNWGGFLSVMFSVVLVLNLFLRAEILYFM